MSTQAERLLRIEHPKTGQRYAVTEANYKHAKLAGLGDEEMTYQDAGFNVVSYEDGTPYEDGAEPTKFGLHAIARVPEIGAAEETEQPTRARARARDTADAEPNTSPDIAPTE